MTNDETSNQEIALKIVTLLRECGYLADELEILSGVILATALHAYAGGLILPDHKEFVVRIFNVLLEKLKIGFKDIFSLSNKELISKLSENKDLCLQYGDMFDQTLSSYKELKKKFNKED